MFPVPPKVRAFPARGGTGCSSTAAALRPLFHPPRTACPKRGSAGDTHKRGCLRSSDSLRFFICPSSPDGAETPARSHSGRTRMSGGAQDALSSASGKAAGTEDRGRTVPPVRAIRPTWAMRRGGRRLRRPRIRGTYFSASITRPISSGIRCSSCAV